MTAAISMENANALSPLNADPVLSAGIGKDEVPSSAAINLDPVKSEPHDTISSLHVATPEKLPLSLPDGPKDYTLPKCQSPPVAELQPVETFVVNAVQSQHEEAPDPAFVQGYRAIADALRRAADPPMLHKVLIALRIAGNGKVLNLLAGHPAKHAQLTHLIFRFNSTKPHKGLRSDDEANFEELCKVYDDGTILDAHLHLILALVSAKSVNLVPALSIIWKMLTKFATMPKFMAHRLHSMLFTMMRLCPKARTELFPIMASKFPFWKWNKDAITWYCEQCFQVLDYLPSIRRDLLEMVIDKCLEIDVNIKIQDNGEVLLEAEKKKEDGNLMNPVSEKKEDDIDELSDKLDSILALLLETIRTGSKDGIGVRDIYYELLPVYESTILTTHKSKFVQYCMFLTCGLESQMINNHTFTMTSPSQQHAILHRDFAAKLLETIVDPYRATLTRQSGACYLASFISRAAYVGPETVCESVSALLRWAEAYIETLSKDSVFAADSREQSDLHSLFYTVCQAAFYIICFRGTEAIKFYNEAMGGYSTMNITNDEEEMYLPDLEHIDLSTKRWTNICNHELQPLRFCLESVRGEFLHIAHAFNLVDDQILDKLVADAKRLSTGRVNKKAASSISTAATLEKQRRTGGVGGLGRGSNPLKSFFPFDPLLLRRSHSFIESFYKHWQGPVEEDDVFVIDDAPDDGDGIFEMDENSDDESDGEASDDEDRLPVVVSDQDTKEDDALDSEEAMKTPDAAEKKEIQRKAWTENVKRPRSQSLENGSW